MCTVPNCNGRLRCTTVSFSQPMPDICLDKATNESQLCDLSLYMRTSMQVSPACELLSMNLQSGQKMVIINLTISPYIDLKLWSDEQWLADFEQNWAFRSL
ncbi:unnamed protein product [Adineta steineri]|uniref:Uncharacterized protein n=1 Tax=Adineta steineri TaxID=433720 RepID=A0A814RYU2_9BILA|nr:unnamed protein product [Adineta steineri]CAF1482583.1 unnamed protein product [Adineta steineri]